MCQGTYGLHCPLIFVAPYLVENRARNQGRQVVVILPYSYHSLHLFGSPCGLAIQLPFKSRRYFQEDYSPNVNLPEILAPKGDNHDHRSGTSIHFPRQIDHGEFYTPCPSCMVSLCASFYAVEANLVVRSLVCHSTSTTSRIQVRMYLQLTF